MLSRLARNFTCKHVIQASTASSHRVGKCIIEPSKQSRIRKRSFWSRRRSIVRWETALSSKERSRRVNCPMLVPFFYYLYFIYKYKKEKTLIYISNLFIFYTLYMYVYKAIIFPCITLLTRREFFYLFCIYIK